MSIATPTNTSLTHEGHRTTLRIAFTYKASMIKSSQFAEVKAIQLALEIAEREKWPALYTDSWMVANALWGWLQKWKNSNQQHRGKPIWAAALWQDITAQVENMTLKVCHVDAHMLKSHTTEEHQNN